MSRVHQIFVAPVRAAPMVARDEARALPGYGLEGDRYCIGDGSFSRTTQKPDYELTLIELENVEAFARATGLAFTSASSRRNIVTVGIRLNDLVDREFMVGSVRARGWRLAEPCKILAARTFPEVLPGLNGKAGLRAQILTEGVIHVGDLLAPV